MSTPLHIVKSKKWIQPRDRVLCEESFKISVLQNLDNQVMYQKKTFPKQSKALENVKLSVKKKQYIKYSLHIVKSKKWILVNHAIEYCVKKVSK